MTTPPEITATTEPRSDPAEPRDREVWMALGLLSCLHPDLTVGADRPMKMAAAILDHVLDDRRNSRERINALQDAIEHFRASGGGKP